MDMKLFTQSKTSPFTTPQSLFRRMKLSAILSTNPTIGTKNNNPLKKKNVYNDSWIEKMAIDHLSRNLQATTGMIGSGSGYDGLVDAAEMVARNFNPSQQHKLILHALEKALPRLILSMIRLLLPHSKFTREIFAAFTTAFFCWLVGPSETREMEINGRREKCVVHIPRCRFLEQTNCVGMCTNLCKIPSQIFIKDSLGMPVNMIPNFDDISCEIIFGQNPPPPKNDPALKQPCYKLCKSNQTHGAKC